LIRFANESPVVLGASGSGAMGWALSGGGEHLEIELKKMGIERIVSRHREEQERVEWEIGEAHINREDYDYDYD
jgi:hypothetical protein